jgi:2-amino-4-hydroxy-6-hydroxymethyldihydropteridine diphosphokinase
MEHFVYYIGIGTNLGFRHDNILRAVYELQKYTPEKIRLSSIYSSKPEGFHSGKDFLNAVMEIKTSKSPLKVLEILRKIEKQIHPQNQKRKSDNTYSNRYLDLDILYYDGPVIFSDELMVPHPRLFERNFALVPLLELNPNLMHPLSNIPLKNFVDNKTKLIKWKDKNQKLICIEGNIGAGKTTLLKNFLLKKTKKIYESFNENPWLGKFYENPEKYALKTEMWFLKNRCREWQYFFPSKHNLIISDYLYLKTKVFAKINLKKAGDNRRFTDAFEKSLFSVPQPDAVIFIHAPLDALKKNILQRNRNYENTINTSYLKNIHHAYLELFREFRHLNIIRVKSSDEAEIELNNLLTLH